VAPQLLENAMKQSRFVEQIMVIGDGQKMPAAFIQPNFDFVKEWAVLHNENIGTTFNEICNNEKVQSRIFQEIKIANQQFGNWEQIKRIELTPDIWSIDGGHLTPTMKLKRKSILEKYRDLFEKIYGS
jgi:long-chain acyl-CoA synthetase